MAKQINKDTIVSADYLDNAIKPLQEYVGLITQADKLLKEFAASMKNSLGFKTDAKGMREQENLQKKINSAYQQKIKLDKESAKLVREQEAAYEKLTKEIKKREAAEQKAHAKREAQYNKEIKQAEELNRPYNKLSSTLNNLRKEYRDLAVQGREFGSRGREIKGQIDQLDKTLKKVDADMGVFSRNVGNYTGAVSRGFKTAMGFVQQFGLALGGIALARSAIDTIVQFDSAIADLSAITGLAGKDLDFFKENAIRLGVNVKGGAKEVVEAYKLIASAKPELLDNAAALNKVTESAILLSRASGMELPDAATALTDAMNQFGAGADQASKFVDVLAAGAKFGSAEIPQITEALLRFGAVAKTSNVNIQESTALIEALAEKGLKGADAGTALRNVMLKLGAPDALGRDAQKRLAALGIDTDKLSNKSLSFAERLEVLKPLLKDNGALVKVFGTENAVAATTLLSTTDRVKELTAAVDENGVAQAQAEARSATLSEAWNRFKETINGLVLEFANGENAAGGLVSALDFLRENIETILKVTFQLIKAFIIFKGVVKTMAVVDFVKANGGLKELTKSMLSLGRTTTDTTTGVKGFSSTLGAIGWAAAISLAIQFATELYNIANGAAQAATDLKNLQNIQANADANASKRISQAQKVRDSEIKFAQSLRERGLITEQGLIEQTRKANERYQQSIQALSDTASKKQAENFKQYQAAVSQLQRLEEKYGKTTFEILRTTGAAIREGGFTGAAVDTNTNAVTKRLAKQVDDLIQRISVLKGQQKGLANEQAAFTGELNATTQGLNAVSESMNSVSKAADNQTKSLKSANDQIERMNTAMTEQQQLIDENITSNAAGNVDAAIQSQIAAIEESGQFSIDLIDELIAREYELRKAIIDRQAVEEIDSATTADEVVNANLRRQQKLAQLDEEFAGRRKKVLDDLNARQEEFANKQYEIEKARLDKIEAERKAAEEKEKARQEALAKFRNQLIQKGTDYLSKQIDKQIALLDKREQKANDLENFLQEAAAQGNIKAEQSIVEQQRIQEEADRKKMELEEKKARIVALGAVLQTYNNKTSAGDKNAFANTVVESGALLAFLQGFDLPGFYVGTDDTGKGGNVDSKGGFAAVLHPNEQVWSKDDRKEVGFKSRQEIKDAVRIADQFNTGNMVYRDQFQGAMAGNTFDIAPMLRKQDEMIKEIKGLPAKDLDVEQLAQGIIMLTTTTTRPNLVKKSQFKIRN